MKMTIALVLEMTADNLRIACDMSRACIPTVACPISPSISWRGTSAATESTTTTSMAPERTNSSVISSASSPQSGWDTRSSSILTPSALAYTGSSACSASMKAALPPAFCTSAAICRATVVLPEDSGPKISMILPFGTPPMPSAISSATEPVCTACTVMCAFSPSFMMEPEPKLRSIWLIAVFSARALSSWVVSGDGAVAGFFFGAAFISFPFLSAMSDLSRDFTARNKPFFVF